jgi:hypothetical protein
MVSFYRKAAESFNLHGVGIIRGRQTSIFPDGKHNPATLRCGVKVPAKEEERTKEDALLQAQPSSTRDWRDQAKPQPDPQPQPPTQDSTAGWARQPPINGASRANGRIRTVAVAMSGIAA